MNLQVIEREQGQRAGEVQVFAKMVAAEMQLQRPKMIEDNISNEKLVELWMHGKSKHTQRVYEGDLKKFFLYMRNKPLGEIKLHELQGFKTWLEEESGLKVSSQARVLSSVKSLLTKACKLGAIPFNVGAQVEQPKVKNTLAERILTQGELFEILIAAKKENTRDYVILRTLYATGIRNAELCGLKWKDIKEHERGAQLTIFGKGSKTRFALIDHNLYELILQLSESRDLEEPVFKSNRGRAFDTSSVWHIIKKYTKKAGIKGNVSPHWFRHAHASHSLDKGVGIHEVQAALGHASLATTSRYVHANPKDFSGLHLDIV